MNVLREHIAKILPTVLDRVLKEKLPDLVRDAMISSFEKNPARQLNAKGFVWAWVIRIQHHWPDVDRYEAAKWLADYMPDRFGHPDYDWSASAAYELADDYVREFGE